jgi:hypothetical protein
VRPLCTVHSNPRLWLLCHSYKARPCLEDIWATLQAITIFNLHKCNWIQVLILLSINSTVVWALSGSYKARKVIFPLERTENLILLLVTWWRSGFVAITLLVVLSHLPFSDQRVVLHKLHGQVRTQSVLTGYPDHLLAYWPIGIANRRKKSNVCRCYLPNVSPGWVSEEWLDSNFSATAGTEPHWPLHFGVKDYVWSITGAW